MVPRERRGEQNEKRLSWIFFFLTTRIESGREYM